MRVELKDLREKITSLILDVKKKNCEKKKNENRGEGK